MGRKLKTYKSKSIPIYTQLEYTNKISYLMQLIINKLMKHGKKQLATSIILQSLNLLTTFSKTKNQNPLFILEQAIRNLMPKVQLKTRRIGGSTYQVPVLLTKLQSVKQSIKWLLQVLPKRKEKTITTKLALEITDAFYKTGLAFKQKEALYKLALINKAFINIV